MTNTMPQFVSLTPLVLSPERVSLNLQTTNFPGKSNVLLDFNFRNDGPLPSKPADRDLENPEELIRNSPYPNVELSVLDDQHNEVAHMFIVEHKEEHISMTMHIHNPQPGKTYIARADMIHNQRLLQTLTIPFKLEPFNAEKKR